MSSVISSITGTSGGRTSNVEGLKELKCPEEGGTKKEYESFLDKLENFVTIQWPNGSDVGYIVQNARDFPVPEPESQTDEEKKVDWKQRLWSQKVDRYGIRMENMEMNKTALYALIMNNISKIVKSKLRSKTGYEMANASNNPLWLFETLEDIMLNFEEVKPKVLAIDDQMERIMNLKQNESSNEDFVKTVSKELKVYEKHGGDFLWGLEQIDGLNERLNKAQLEYKQSNNNLDMPPARIAEERSILKKGLKEEILAMAILKRADPRRYGSLQTTLKNSYLFKDDNYPKTIADTLRVLNNYTQDLVPLTNTHADGGGRSGGSSIRNGGQSASSRGIAFLQTTGGNCSFLKGTDNGFHPEITCYLCGIKGHYKGNCPVATNSNGAKIRRNRTQGQGQDHGTTSTSSGRSTSTGSRASVTFQNAPGSGTGTAAAGEVSPTCGVSLNQTNIDAYINPNWVLLNSESTDHIFCNRNLLTDVNEVTNGEYLRLHSSGGYLDTHRKGRFGDFTVWYNPDSLANILSLNLVTEKYRVTLDSEIDNSFSVHISENHVIKFIRGSNGLYYFDASKIDLSKLRNAFSFLTTVSDKKKLYRTRDVRKATDAVILNRKVNHMAKDKFILTVAHGRIRNNPITVGDIRRSHDIYGPPLPTIKGRTRYKESKRVKETQIVEIPESMYENLKHVTLCVDFHYVNGITVFHSISRRIDYRTVSFPLNRSKATIIKELKDIFKVYNARGFRITELHADSEFTKVEKDILPVRLRPCGTDDHVPEVERSVQTQKNENRSLCHGMPY